ncbi:arginine--tRNA ligase [Clostridia bacterium]|nr:arginine--tRNA ligase [Clostridia bacterium]
MSINYVQKAKDQLAQIVADAYGGELPVVPHTEIPKERAHGDFSTSFAMQAAKLLKQNPRAIGQAMLDKIDLAGSYFASAEMLGAGFINVRLNDSWYSDVLNNCQLSTVDCQLSKVMVEFVSANPTGPMTIGNARGGVLGDALASVLEQAGFEVWREFYLNDAGNQVDNFGKSLKARYEQLFDESIAFPEDGYHGDDVKELAKLYFEQHGKVDVSAEEFAAWALPLNVERMRRDLERYGVSFDNWFAESALHASGAVADTLAFLTERGYTYEKDGAVWLKTSEFGCEKDDVLRKSNGFYTYFAVDIAYHRDKFARGFDTCINIWGADHHGHVARLKAAVKALGLEPERLVVVLMQFVNLVRDGEVVKISKRTGKTITLSDLLDEIPRDAARFFFNNRSSDSKLDFDMELAARQDSENPVYYVQYAHARIVSMLKLLDCEPEPNAELLTHETERALIRQLAQYPEVIRVAAKELEPSGVNVYLIELAGGFHRFYNAVRLKGSEPDVLAARAALCAAVRGTLARGLKLLGIDAPDNM